MMPTPDDFSRLWQSVPAGPAPALRQIEARARRFDRTIRNRDWRESGAGLLVAAVFLWMSFHARGLALASDLWLAACGIWVVFYLRRYSRTSGGVPPEKSLAAYRRAVLERFDRQIRVVRSAKYWYILPFWAGLMLNAAAFYERTGVTLRFLLLVVFVTALNAALWWVNDVAAVRYLQGKRRELLELFGEEGDRDE